MKCGRELATAPAQGVEKDGQRDDHTNHHLLPERGDLELVKSVAQHGEYQGADQGAGRAAHAAGQRGAMASSS